MQGHFREVFAPLLGLEQRDFEAKEVFEGVMNASEARTRRGHNQRPSEADSLDALRQIEAVLRKCGECDGADEVNLFLTEA